MALIVNGVLNPSCETNTTGYSAIAGTSGVAAITRPTDGGWVGDAYARCTWSTASTAAGGGIQYGDITVAVGEVWSFSAYVRASKTNRFQLNVEWRSGGGTLSTVSGTQTVITVDADFPDAVRLTADNLTAPASATIARIKVVTVSGTSYANWSIGDTMDVDALMAVKETASVAYGDPTTSGVWVWNGTAHASTSTWYQGAVTLTPDVTDLPYMEVLVEDLSVNVATVTIHRLTAGRDFRVRGAVNVAVSGAITRVDAECPFNVSTTYKAEMFDSGGESLGYTLATAETLATSETWIHNPLDLTGAVMVELLDGSGSTISRPIDAEVVHPFGRVVGVVISRGRKGLTDFPLLVSTSTTADADKFTVLLGDYETMSVPVLCIRSGTSLRIPKPFFMAVLDPKEIGVNIQNDGELIDWEMNGDEVAPPAPGIIAPLLTRANLNAYYGTRTAMNADNLTRLAVNRRYDIAGTV